MTLQYEMAECYRQLEQGEYLSERHCSYIYSAKPPGHQIATLTVRLLSRRRAPFEDPLLRWVFSEYSSVRWLIRTVYHDSPVVHAFVAEPSDSSPLLSEDDLTGLKRIRQHHEVGLPFFQRYIEGYLRGTVPEVAMAFMLGLIVVEGLSEDDVGSLTFAMAHSGEVWDYRKYAEDCGRRMVRRYPTGGVSEKVALILPSVCSALSDDFPILTTTLVGRSLGFTGGTWDKLSVIGGFSFPAPGHETERVLAACGAAMCTTGERVDPADRELYMLRSVTGTVVSEALIVSSVASKHLALLPHGMLLDVRFGRGAFLRSRGAAEALASHLERLLRAGGIQCCATFTDTRDPAGVTAGNTPELVEALAVMGAAQVMASFDPGSIQQQRDIVASQTVQLLSLELPNIDREQLRSRIDVLFQSGRVLGAFYALLCAHSVPPYEAERICSRPESLLEGFVEVQVLSSTRGRLIELDQVKLGNLVNFALPPPSMTEPGGNRSGVRLKKRVGDHVAAGEPLCSLYLYPEVRGHASVEDLRREFASCFTVGVRGAT